MAFHQLAVARAVLFVLWMEEAHFDTFKELLSGQTGREE